MATNVLCIGLMDRGGRALTIIVGSKGWAFANENCPLGREFDQCFQMPGVCSGKGMLAAGVDSNITLETSPIHQTSQAKNITYQLC